DEELRSMHGSLRWVKLYTKNSPRSSVTARSAMLRKNSAPARGGTEAATACTAVSGYPANDLALPQQPLQRGQIACAKRIEPPLAGREPFLEQLLHFQLLVGRLEVAARQLAGQVGELRCELGSSTRSHLQLDEILLDSDQLLIELIGGLLDRVLVDDARQPFDLAARHLDVIHEVGGALHVAEQLEQRRHLRLDVRLGAAR